jgi:hypothetical protein
MCNTNYGCHLKKAVVYILENSSPNRNHGKTKPNKNGVFLMIWDVGFPV